MTKDAMSTFNVSDVELDPIIVKEGSYFYLWCCDCRLRHLVFVDKHTKGNIKIGLARDEMATTNARKLENIVVYKKNAKKDNKAK